MKITNGIKSMPLKNGEFLYFWYANNKDRGDNNVTIIRSGSAIRASVSAKQTDIVSSTLTSGWAGNVNFSAAVQTRLGM